MNIDAFRDHVQGYLRTGGYKQEELAQTIGLHPKVLSRKLNKNANAQLTLREVREIVVALADWHVLTTHDDLLDLLAAADIDTGILQRSDWQTPLLHELPRRRPARPPLNQPAPCHNLPATLTRLIGRDWAVERLHHLLAKKDTRLVTLVGAGGSGKTLLALHVARRLLDVFARGVWFVSLASVTDADLVPLSIIQALNIQSAPSSKPLQSLTTYLSDKELLLVLDNFEHLGAARNVIDAILAIAPRVTVLITSRVVQRLYGEREFRVPPLDIPDPGVALQTRQLTQYGAVQLFLERAQAVAPDFALTDDNAATVAQICARVDGLPLALELAAARVKILSPQLLLERLAQASLPILTRGPKNLPSRQQTLSNTIQWSYDLLAPDEQLWFCRLAIFSDSWALETTTAMMQELPTTQDSPSDALDLLEQLVDNSLLVRLPDEQKQARFLMLSTLREYALKHLTGQNDYERLRDWHACYYLRKAEKAMLDLRGPQQLRTVALLRASNENFRTALEWSLQKARDGLTITIFPPSGQANGHASTDDRAPSSRSALEFCLRLAAALRPCWEWQGNLIEARYWLNAVLRVPLAAGAAQTMLAARAYALSEAARLIFLQNEKTRALELIEESLALWQQLGDQRGLAMAMLHRGWVAHGMDEYEAAKAFYQQGIASISPEEDTWLYVQLLVHLAAAAGFTSDYELADACYERSRELSAQIGDKSAVADTWKDQGGILLLQSKWNEALACLVKSIQICQEIGHKQFLATGLGLVSFAIGMREEPDPQTASLHSARVKGATDALMERIGLHPWTRTSPFIQAVRQLIRSRVDEQSWEAAWLAGYALPLDEAIELVYRLSAAPQ